MAMKKRFRTRNEVERYFSGRTIKCLICGKRFGRLSFHLAAKHAVTTDEYKFRFGLPWSRGLTSAASHANSGWNASRKRAASRVAHRTQFFKHAHALPRRAFAPFLAAEAARHLGTHAKGFGKSFEKRVLTLFRKGLTDEKIAAVLDVARMTINRRTRKWRKQKNRR